MRNARVLTIQIHEADTRLDLALLRRLREETGEGLALLSRSTLKQWFKKDAVLANGRPVASQSAFPPGPLEIEILDWEGLKHSTDPQAQPSRALRLPVIYEDDSLLVLHKRSGVPSIPHEPSETETAVGAALAHFPGMSRIGRGGLEPGLLHRLDTGTSGLLAFAKTDAEFTRLSQAWKSGKVVKIYRAIGSSAEGRMPKAPLALEPQLAHDAGSSRRMIVVEKGTRVASFRGKPLPTRTRIESVRGISAGLDFTIRIETGVMHQIRCTLAWLGYPIAGDSVYRGPVSKRLWLHAWKLSLPLSDGSCLELEAALPGDWPTG